MCRLISIYKYPVKKIFVILLSFVSTYTYAQKLPKIQQVNQRAPFNIKIDGKASEWNNKFLAFNTNVELFYTLSNDDKNLYLTVRAVDALVIRKIINAGLVFTINPSGNKSDTSHQVSVTFPIFDKKNRPMLNLRQKPVVTKDSTVSSKQIDSFMNAANQQIALKAKEIKVLGIPSIGDTLISVYNDNEIKAGAQFDHQIAYNFELAIPIKYLRLNINDQQKFSYNILLNGSNDVEGAILLYKPDGKPAGIIVPKNPPRGIEIQYMQYPNDFWGEYILAK